MRIRYFSTLFGVGVLVIGATADAQTAFEGNIMAYPAAMCRFYGTLASDTKYTPVGFNAVGVKNTATTDQTLMCPLPADNGVDQLFGMGQILTRDAGIDLTNYTSGTTRCYWEFRSSDGATTGSVQLQIVNPLGNGRTSLSFLNDAAPDVLDSYGKYASIWCSGIKANTIVEGYYHVPWYETPS